MISVYLRKFYSNICIESKQTLKTHGGIHTIKVNEQRPKAARYVKDLQKQEQKYKLKIFPPPPNPNTLC